MAEVQEQIVMAKPKKNPMSVAKFVDALTINVDGKNVFVPSNQAANKQLNCLIVSQMRQVLQENIKRIRDLESTLTPREMKDMVDSIAALTKASAEVYQTVEEGDMKPKPVAEAGKDEADAIEVDFEVLTQKPNGSTNPPDQSPAPAAQP